MKHLKRFNEGFGDWIRKQFNDDEELGLHILKSIENDKIKEASKKRLQDDTRYTFILDDTDTKVTVDVSFDDEAVVIISKRQEDLVYGDILELSDRTTDKIKNTLKYKI